MTGSKAIKLLEYIRETGNGEAPYVGCAQNIAIDMAINALKKQIPKKPKTDDRYIMYICPCCNDFIKVNHNYCTNCGQKLDWSDRE